MPPALRVEHPISQTAGITGGGHGRKTLAAGVIAVLLLLIALFGVLWFTLGRQNLAVRRADLYNSAVAEIQKLLCGMEEMPVTEGAPASRSLATEGLAQLIALQASLDSGALSGRANIDFEAFRAHATAYIAEKDVSVSNTAAIKALGVVTVQGAKLRDALIVDEVQARGNAQRAATTTPVAR